MTKLRLLTRNLLEDLKKLTAEADTIYWMTDFLMKSGVKEVLPVLREAALRGAEIKILTGDYLSITQPGALDYSQLKWRNNRYDEEELLRLQMRESPYGSLQ
ncbi:hypothetical protein [Sporosarcina sp.]|uniref:hypothetical protein n=1 Tax=Sporosarcina sp. TaxID=49982 RepID=UPI0026225093|nr:hypothetical protein [Sporosarcina sp.]